MCVLLLLLLCVLLLCLLCVLLCLLCVLLLCLLCVLRCPHCRCYPKPLHGITLQHSQQHTRTLTCCTC